jgi:U2 small nuclear ribonucleoprotein B''
MTMTEDAPPNHTIYIKNLNDKIKQDRLKQSLYASFSPHGKILEIVMGKARKLRGQAWITFDDITMASNALRSMNGTVFFEKTLVIQFAKDKADVIARREGTFKPREKRKRDETKQETTTTTTTSTKKSSSKTTGPPPSMHQNLPNKILFLQELPESCNNEMLSVLFQQYHGFKVRGLFFFCFLLESYDNIYSCIITHSIGSTNGTR